VQRALVPEIKNVSKSAADNIFISPKHVLRGLENQEARSLFEIGKAEPKRAVNGKRRTLWSYIKPGSAAGKDR